MASSYRTNVAKGWADMGSPFYLPTYDGIIRCPKETPYQCGYHKGNPVCVSHPSQCPYKGLPAASGDGSSLVPVAHPPQNSSYGWCGGNTNKLIPATQNWSRSCRSTMPDLQNIVDGVYNDGLPYLQLASPQPKGSTFDRHKILVTNREEPRLDLQKLVDVRQLGR